MSSTTPLTDAINALTTYANEITGQSDTTLSDAVGSLVDGYGGGTNDYLTIFISRGQLGDWTFNNDTFDDYLFYNTKFTSLSLPNLVTSIKDGMFKSATIGTLNLPALKTCRNNYFEGLRIQSLSLPSLVTCGSDCFLNCSAEELSMPNFVNATGQTAFKKMRNLINLVLPKCTTPGNYGIEGCTKLKKVDFTALSSIPQGLFNQSTALDDLILRNPSMVTLSNVNAFNNMHGKAVNVYVPSAIKSTYEGNATWSSVSTASLTFVAIEGSAYEIAYADGTPISTT